MAKLDTKSGQLGLGCKLKMSSARVTLKSRCERKPSQQASGST